MKKVSSCNLETHVLRLSDAPHQETALRIMAADVGDVALFRKEWPKADRYLLTEAGWFAGLA
jgi:hypothetical protein